MPSLIHHTLPSKRVLPIIVGGKVKVMACCLSVTFPDNYKKFTFQSRKLIKTNSTYDHTHQLGLPNLDASYATVSTIYRKKFETAMQANLLSILVS